jgi:beta-lactamase regulating signal transducer with metallopeptidase domain
VERDVRTDAIIYLIILFTSLTIISTLFSVSTVFLALALAFALAEFSIGACVEIMIRLGKWEWAAQTEKFKDGSFLKSIKPMIIGVWGVGFIICVLSVFVIRLTM